MPPIGMWILGSAAMCPRVTPSFPPEEARGERGTRCVKLHANALERRAAAPPRLLPQQANRAAVSLPYAEHALDRSAFPAPFSPSRPNTVPPFTERLKWSTSTIPEYDFVSLHENGSAHFFSLLTARSSI